VCAWCSRIFLRNLTAFGHWNILHCYIYYSVVDIDFYLVTVTAVSVDVVVVVSVAKAVDVVVAVDIDFRR